MPEYNFTFDWNRITTIGKVKILAEQVVGNPSQAQISQAVEDYIEAHPGSLSPLSPAVKSALLQIAEKVAYIDEHGEDYYDALDAALNARALLQITAVYTQSGTVYDTDSLDSLKADLVVTAYYDDSTTANVTNASVLSGTLTEGTSTITVTFNGKTATFNVIVSENTDYTPADLVIGTLVTGSTFGYSGGDGGRLCTNPIGIYLPAGNYSVECTTANSTQYTVVKTILPSPASEYDFTVERGVAETIATGCTTSTPLAFGTGTRSLVSDGNANAVYSLYFKCKGSFISVPSYVTAIKNSLKVTKVID